MSYKQNNSEFLIFNFCVMNVLRVLESNQLVNLVFFGQISGPNSIPNAFNYKHRNIKKIVPCEVVNGNLVSLLTGKVVNPEGNVQQWPLLRGSVLDYGSQGLFIVSLRYVDSKLLLLEISADEFHPESMVKLPFQAST